MRLFSTWTHGVLDYLTAGALLALPQATGWGGRASRLLRGAALATLAYSLLTRYELGLLKLLPFKAHLALDAASGALFCAAPLLLPEERRRGALAGLGLFEIGVVLLTEPEPRGARARG